MTDPEHEDLPMRILICNVNTTASMTDTMVEAARGVAAPGTEIGRAHV